MVRLSEVILPARTARAGPQRVRREELRDPALGRVERLLTVTHLVERLHLPGISRLEVVAVTVVVVAGGPPEGNRFPDERSHGVEAEPALPGSECAPDVLVLGSAPQPDRDVARTVLALRGLVVLTERARDVAVLVAEH